MPLYFVYFYEIYKNNINNNEILKILNKFEEQYLHDIINNKTENNLKLILKLLRN